MQPNTFTVFITSWTDYSLYPEENHLPYIRMSETLNSQYPGKVQYCAGSFGGAKELGFRVQHCTKVDAEELLWLAGEFNQQCILVLNEQTYESEFWGTDGCKENTGKLFSLHLNSDGELKDFTYVDGKYYVLRKL